MKEKQYSAILFDLDGTLTDSGPGVMHGFEYAIRKMGREVPDGEQLRRFMGPPLQESFGRMLGYSEEDTARAVSLYREYYFSRGGIRENTVYPGVEQLLADLRQRGKTLAVATSKSVDGAEAVLERFGLRSGRGSGGAGPDHEGRRAAVCLRPLRDQPGERGHDRRPAL